MNQLKLKVIDANSVLVAYETPLTCGYYYQGTAETYTPKGVLCKETFDVVREVGELNDESLVALLDLLEGGSNEPFHQIHDIGDSKMVPAITMYPVKALKGTPAEILDLLTTIPLNELVVTEEVKVEDLGLWERLLSDISGELLLIGAADNVSIDISDGVVITDGTDRVRVDMRNGLLTNLTGENETREPIKDIGVYTDWVPHFAMNYGVIPSHYTELNTHSYRHNFLTNGMREFNRAMWQTTGCLLAQVVGALTDPEYAPSSTLNLAESKRKKALA